MVNPKFQILDDVTNTSDHLAIKFSFFLSNNISIESPKKSIPKLKLDIPEIGKFYFDSVSFKLNQLFKDQIIENFKISELKQDEMDKFHNNLTQSFVTAETKSLNFQKYFDNEGLTESNKQFESYILIHLFPIDVGV